MRSPSPEQCFSLLQRSAMILGTHGVPSRCASVHRCTCQHHGRSHHRILLAGNVVLMQRARHLGPRSSS